MSVFSTFLGNFFTLHVLFDVIWRSFQLFIASQEEEKEGAGAKELESKPQEFYVCIISFLG
jgi:hypothetical protein